MVRPLFYIFYRYHDMADVIDFIVLKQNYDAAVKQNWKIGENLLSMIIVWHAVF